MVAVSSTTVSGPLIFHQATDQREAPRGLGDGETGGLVQLAGKRLINLTSWYHPYE